MAHHVAILLRPYLRLILSGRKTVESRLTRTARPPFKRIAPDDVIYFKVSGGPFLAMATAARVEFHEALTPAKIDALYTRLNHAICGTPEHWQAKRQARYATFIWLRDVRPIASGPPIAPSRGPAWFVLDPVEES
jgi:ASC-1-like (ASCH) protein